MSAEWSIAQVAHSLGGAKKLDLLGRRWRCLCPVHDDHHPSLDLTDTQDGEMLWICRAGCYQRAIGRVLFKRDLLPPRVMAQINAKIAARKAKPRPPGSEPAEPAPPAPKPRPSSRPPVVDGDKPLRLFDRAVNLKGTPGERYLVEVRASLILPAHEAVRFMPAQPPHFPWPGLIARVTDFAVAGRVMTLHFTDLLPDGSGKAPIEPNKRTLKGYPMMGGVVRLTDDAEVTYRIGVAEGIEKAQSIMSSYAHDLGRVEHVWSALNAGNMASLPVVPGIETLVIYGDPNAAGRKAAATLKQRWLDAGREVELHFPPGKDWDEAP